MIGSIFIWLLSTVLLSTASSAEAQQPNKIPRIGFLGAVSSSANLARAEAFRQGLRDAGYIEGQNITIEYRYAEGKFDRLSALAAEFVALKVDVIVTGGSSVTRRVKEATETIPIVMSNDSDPVGNGFVESLARPGGNITGLATLTPDLAGKRLELLREIVPKLSRVAVFGTSTEPGNAQALKETELAARAFNVQIQYLDIPGGKEIEAAFQAASKGGVEAVFVLTGPVFVSQRKRLAASAVKSRLPAIYYRSDFVEDGGLLSYAPSLTDLSRRAAIYVDKILKGAKPADLPVEQPTKFEFFINLKTAKQIGLTIPPNVLARADRVIK
ncbi:MAG: ABC transporter substrate-binding protein [Candidatus Binatia bacterium]